MLGWPSTFEFEDHRRRSKPRFTAVQIRISRLMMNHTGNPTYGLNKRRFKRVLKSPAFAAGLSNVCPFGLDFDPSPLGTASGLINSPPNASNRVPQTMVRTKKLSISNLIYVAMVSENSIQPSVHWYNHIRGFPTRPRRINCHWW